MKLLEGWFFDRLEVEKTRANRVVAAKKGLFKLQAGPPINSPDVMVQLRSRIYIHSLHARPDVYSRSRARLNEPESLATYEKMNEIYTVGPLGLLCMKSNSKPRGTVCSCQK